MKIIETPLDEIRPYKRNAKKHDAKQVANVAESIRQYGFVQPIVVDSDGVIVIGHCRYAAAKELGMTTVPCVCVDELTPAQVDALRIVDNKTNESPWDIELLMEDLPRLDLDAFDFDFALPEIKDEADEAEEDGGEHDGAVEDSPEQTADEYAEMAAEFAEKMAAGENMEEDEEYQEFLEKFKPKKTTDDCYTPGNVYDIVRDWAVREYGLQGCKIVRPFYPGGDYTREEYQDGCVVIDNPPFSILSEICKYYDERSIRFFLFSPHLTLFSTGAGAFHYVVANCQIRYENGAIVSTSFVTNMGEDKIRTASELHDSILEANAENIKKYAVDLPKYDYPIHVATAARLGYIVSHGQDLRVNEAEACFIRQLDAMKEAGKTIYGGGFLLAEKAAAEKAAAEKAAAQKWALSENEKSIIARLGQ